MHYFPVSGALPLNCKNSENFFSTPWTQVQASSLCQMYLDYTFGKTRTLSGAEQSFKLQNMNTTNITTNRDNDYMQLIHYSKVCYISKNG